MTNRDPSFLSDSEREIDEALEQSFPASDPPWFVGKGARPGGRSRKRRKPGDFTENFAASPFVAIRH
jgi:hypothetical protein